MYDKGTVEGQLLASDVSLAINEGKVIENCLDTLWLTVISQISVIQIKVLVLAASFLGQERLVWFIHQDYSKELSG